MPRTLQNAKFNARAFSYNLLHDEAAALAHIVGMTKDDINAGPNYLRAWREFRGLTQAQLAERVNAGGPMIALLENGQRGLSAKWLRKFAIALRTTPGAILEIHPTDGAADIIDLWSKAGPRERQQLSDIARTLIEKN